MIEPLNLSLADSRFGKRNCLVVFLLLVTIPLYAADLLVMELQKELQLLFPRSVLPSSTIVAPEPHSPFAIISQEPLLALAPTMPSTPGRLSLRKIRNSPPAIRNAYAACVKVITPYWHGAGVIISSNGLVLTSYHLVAGVPFASVQTLDGIIYPVTNISAASAIHDLALLQIPPGSFNALEIGRTDEPATGHPISVIGHPGDFSWHSVTGLSLRCLPDRGTHVLHFEAPVGRGNSGGPVVDQDGRLIAITACLAELANGGRVKVGISAQAIRSFLEMPRQPMRFADLSRMERNRRLTDFLAQLGLIMDIWINDWLAAMSGIAIRDADPGTDPSIARRVRFTETQRAAEVSARLLLLKAMLVRSAYTPDIDPQLRASIDDSAKALDSLIDGSLLLGGKTDLSAQDSRTRLAEAARCRQSANRHFARALAGLQSSSARLDLQVSDPLRYQRISAIQARHSSVGCRVEN